MDNRIKTAEISKNSKLQKDNKKTRAEKTQMG